MLDDEPCGAAFSDGARPAGNDAAVQQSAARPRVMVADAQLLFADALALSLDQSGTLQLEPQLPATGLEAVRVIGGVRPDVALLDYGLPGMPGAALVKSLRVHAPATRLVHLAWFCGPDDIERSLAAGAAGFLSKRLRVSVVTDAVLRVAGGERPVVAGRGASLTRLPPAAAATTPPDGRASSITLTARQLQTLELLAVGLSVAEIAGRLGIVEGTVRMHIRHLFTRLGARSQLEAVTLAREAGVLA